jgi:hypothetical protein
MNRYIRRIVFSLLLQALISLAAWHRGWLSVEIFHWLLSPFKTLPREHQQAPFLILRPEFQVLLQFLFQLPTLPGPHYHPTLQD